MSNKVTKQKEDDLIDQLILRLLIDPNDQQFLDVLSFFSKSKQLTKFHRLLFNNQLEVQKNFYKKVDLIERLRNEWTVDREDDEDKKEIESEISYQLLYSTHSNYGIQIAKLPFSQKLDIWSIFLEQDLNKNQLCLQLLSTFLLHFDATSTKIVPLFQSKLDEIIKQTTEKLEKLIDLNLIDKSYDLLRCLELVYNWGQFLLIHKIYRKNKSTELINEQPNQNDSELNQYDLSSLHSYKNAKFWKKFLKLAFEKEEKNLEITELINKLIIQNLIFQNSSSISSLIKTNEHLNQLNNQSTKIILKSIFKYPVLVFYLNLEHVYELFSDEDLESLFKSLFNEYANKKESKYLTFLSQNSFKSSKRIQTLMINVFIEVLNEICSSNTVQNASFLSLLSSINSKRWPLNMYSTKLANNELGNDLTELASNLDNLTPIKGFQDTKVQNLFIILDKCILLDRLSNVNECLLIIVILAFQMSYLSDQQLSKLVLNCFIRILESPIPINFLDIYPSHFLVKKLFVVLAPFNVNSCTELIRLLAYKIILKEKSAKESTNIKMIFSFLSKLDSKTTKPKYVDDLKFALRSYFLIELNKCIANKSVKRNVGLDDFKDLIAENVEKCILQLDHELTVDTFSKSFKVFCMEGLFNFFNVDTLNPEMIKKLNFQNYFGLSLRLTFGGLFEAKSLNESKVFLDYLTFLLKNDRIYSKELGKFDLIQIVWSILIFKPLGLSDVLNEEKDNQDVQMQNDDIEMIDEQQLVETSNLKRKISEYNPVVKKMKVDHIENQEEENRINRIQTDILLELTRITLLYCSGDQLNNFLNLLTNKLKKLNSDHLDESIDFKTLDDKIKFLFLVKAMFQDPKSIILMKEDKLDVIKNETIPNLIVEIVSYAKNIYFIKSNLQSDIEKEEIKDEVEIKNSKLDDLKNNLEQIFNVQILTLEIVELILSAFKSRVGGNLTNQLVNFSMVVYEFADLDACQENYPKYFSRVFNCIYMALNRVLKEYEFTCENALPVYINMVNKLIRNLCRISFQIRFLSLSNDIQSEIEKCSINLQHLLILLSKNKEYLACTINIIITFINEDQKDLIYLKIKNRILIGIYKLLNSSAKDNDFQFIHSRLNQDGRQTFSQIYDNYEKFYRYRSYA